jgi:hypothetical protein
MGMLIVGDEIGGLPYPLVEASQEVDAMGTGGAIHFVGSEGGHAEPEEEEQPLVFSRVFREKLTQLLAVGLKGGDVLLGLRSQPGKLRL